MSQSLELRTQYGSELATAAVGTEAAIEGILNSLEPKKEGEVNESAKEE